MKLVAEDVSSEGRCDLAVRGGNTVWDIEFKVIQGEQGPGDALKQFKQKGYATK